MRKFVLSFMVAALGMISLPVFSQDKKAATADKSKDLNATDSTLSLGMAGDGLDLYAVLDLFQKSKTIESFEKSLNDSKTKINNLDLDLDKKVDFIKVVTEKKDSNSYAFILRVDVSKTETQDVAVILLDRGKDKKISLQCVGDEDLYGKDYVIEPKGNSSVTPNPAYKGPDPVTVTVEAQPTTVVVQQAPIVQYVYSPAYAPYYPPYAYGYYPGWFAFTAVVSFGFYAAAWGGYHGGYYGGHYHGGNNNVIINNNNNFNNYNNNKMRSTNVSDNRARGNYGDDRGSRGNNASTRPSTSDRSAGGNRGGDRAGAGASTRPSTSDRSTGGNRGGDRAGSGASTRPTTSDRSSNPGGNSRSSSGGSRPSTSNYGGGGRSMGGGGGGGGGFRGGGGGRRR